jgi:hypothetical protein
VHHGGERLRVARYTQPLAAGKTLHVEVRSGSRLTPDDVAEVARALREIADLLERA